MSPAPISESQLAANRENSKHSTGPRSAEGKSRTRLNGLRHGLTGQTAFLPEEDRAAYDRHHADFRAHLKPQSLIETQTVHQLADDYWRLNRLKAIETNIFALGIEAHSEELEDDSLSQAQAYLDNARELNLLSLYEQRLNRAINSRQQQLLRLRELRKEEEVRLAFRKRAGLISHETEVQTQPPAQATPRPAPPTQHTEDVQYVVHGFGFSDYKDPGTGFPARVYPPKPPSPWERAARARALELPAESPALRRTA